MRSPEQTGPYSDRPGFGTLAEAMSGYAYITGQPDGPPTLPAFGLADSVAGMTGVIAILAALHYRGKTGVGQHIDVSLLEPLMSILGPMFIEYDQHGTVPKRLGSRLPFSAPRNVYETKDGKALALSSSGQRAFERTVTAIGRADLIVDPRFRTNRDRGANVEALDAEIGGWIAERTAEEAMVILVDSGAAAMPVYNVPEIFTDPHVEARESLVTIEDPHLGPVRFQNVPVKMSETQPDIRFTGRELGEDNEAVYGDMLGLSAENLARLKDEGIV